MINPVKQTHELEQLTTDLAQLLGWTWSNGAPPCWNPPPEDHDSSICEDWHGLPNVTDLNVVRRAELVLISEDMVPDWVANLVDLICPVPGWSGVGRISAASLMLGATGPQRAQALVKTVKQHTIEPA